MKRKILITLFLTFFTFSFTWAVWEGNAGVGSSGEFAENEMLVKSDMFPKNTIVEIINLENSTKARAIVIGDSGIPGLLISLSPATAKKLNVPYGKIVRVRVTTPNHSESDELISDDAYETDDIDYNPKKAIAKSDKEAVDPVKEKNDGIKATVFFDEASSKDYKAPKKPKAVTKPKPVEPEPVIEPEPKPIVEPEPEPEPIVEPEPVIEPEPEPIFEPEPIETNDKDAYLEKAELRPPKDIGFVDNTPVQPAPVKPEPPVKAPKPSKEDTVYEVDDGLNDVPEEYKPVSEVGTPVKPDAQESENQKPVHEVGNPAKPSPEKNEAQKPVNEVDTPDEQTSAEAESQKPVSEVDTPVEPNFNNAESKKAVGEVGTPSKPEKEDSESHEPVYEIDEPEAMPEAETPANDPVPTTPTEVTPEVFDEDDVYVVDDTEPEVEEIEEPTPVKPPKKKAPEPVIEVEDYELEDDAEMYFGKLERGKYYLQIASYKKELNVKGILTKHAHFYPLVVQKTGSGNGTRYKVFVGPLEKDEMGAVMSRFYKFGFKDSFFKVIR